MNKNIRRASRVTNDSLVSKINHFQFDFHQNCKWNFSTVSDSAMVSQRIRENTKLRSLTAQLDNTAKEWTRKFCSRTSASHTLLHMVRSFVSICSCHRAIFRVFFLLIYRSANGEQTACQTNFPVVQDRQQQKTHLFCCLLILFVCEFR